jgi:serine/threonine protein kinase
VTQHTGERFGLYRLLRSLGEGTFGDVYYGEHVHHNTPAAIKVFKTKLTPDKFKGFLNEVRTVLLKHPDIVEIPRDAQRAVSKRAKWLRPFFVASLASV